MHMGFSANTTERMYVYNQTAQHTLFSTGVVCVCLGVCVWITVHMCSPLFRGGRLWLLTLPL